LIKDIETALNTADHMREIYTNQLAALEQGIADITAKIDMHQEAIRLCEACLSEQDDLRGNVENALTALLQGVFDDSYEFRYDATYKDKEKKILSGLRHMVYKNGIPGEAVPGGDHGGGILNVVNFGLQSVVARLVPGFVPFMCIDEGFANMNERRFPAVSRFIDELNKISPIQTINITHTDAEFPQTIRVSMPGTISVVESLTGEQE
jgi:DNA repair exonuclease SbcCD ATPase subunit